MTQPMWQHAVRRAVGPLAGLALVLAACSAPSVHDDRAPTATLVARAHEALQGDAAERAAGHRDLTWLCLLRGSGCADLAQHGRAALTANVAEQTPEALLETLTVRALALDGGLAVAERTHAWLDVAVAATTPQQQHKGLRELTLLAAARAVAVLHSRDPDTVAAVLRARGDDAGRLLEAGTATGRWLRLRALSAAVQDGDWPAAESAGNRWQVPQVRQAVQPLSSRAALAVARQTAADAAAPLGATQTLGPQQQTLTSPANRDRGAWALALTQAGAWRLEVALPTANAPQTLLVKLPKALRAFAQAAGQWVELTPQALTDDGVQALALPADATTVQLVTAFGVGPQVVEAAVVPTSDAEGWLRAPTALPLPRALVAALTRLTALPAAGRSAPQRPIDALAALQSALAERVADAQAAVPSQDVLDLVLQVLPGHVEARLALVQRLLDDGNLSQAARWLAESPAPQLDAAKPQPQRTDVLLATSAVRHAEGLVDLAARALDEAVARNPLRCGVQAVALQLGLDTLQREPLRRWLGLDAGRPVGNERCAQNRLLYANALRTLGQRDAAAQQLAAAAAHPQLAWGAAQLASELGLPFDAALLPDAARWRAVEASWDGQSAETRQAALLQLLLDPVASLSLKERALAAGAQMPWGPLVRDGLELAAQPDDPRLVGGATQAWLLDQELVLLLPGGGAVRRVHQVLRVLTDAAAEAVGEVAVPEGAELELARTILSDGTVVQPAETADKSSVSLRMVEAGSAVEYAQTVFVPADDAVSAATRLPVFLFQATDAPVRLSEYAVIVPAGMQLQSEPTRWLPPAEIRPLANGMTAWIWRTGGLPPLPDEPRAVRADLARPAVRVTAQVNAQDYLDALDDTLLAWLPQRDAGLQTWLTATRAFPSTVKGLQLLSARLSRLTEYAHDGGPPGPPEAIAQSGKGDRATLFWWLARQRGLDACLVRVAPLARLPLRAPVDPNDYAMELVRVRLNGRDHWYDPGLEGGLIDHVRAGLRGRSGWLVGCAQSAPVAERSVEVPPLGEGKDTRRVAASLHWRADGSIQVQVHEQLHGAMAGALRQFFWQANPSTYKGLLQDLAGSSFPDTTGTLDDVEGLTELGGPVQLRYTLTAPAQSARQRQLALGLLPAGLGQTYAGLPRRSSQLLFGWGGDESLELHIRSDSPLRNPSTQTAATEGPLQWQIRLQPTPVGATVTKRLRSTPAVIAPDAYPPFANALRQLDAAERLRLER